MTIAPRTASYQELVEKPRRWNIQFIRNFMMTFGTLSSVFDYLTFGMLLLILHATTDQFRTGWFLEAVISNSVTVLVIRTRRTFFRSKTREVSVDSHSADCRCGDHTSNHPTCRASGFSTFANQYPSCHWHYCGVEYYCSRNNKRVFYKKGNFLKDTS